MKNEKGFNNRFRSFLSRRTPEKVVGVGELAVFGATAVLYHTIPTRLSRPYQPSKD